MEGEELAREVAQLLRRLAQMEGFSAEDYEAFSAELIREYHRGGIPADLFEAIRDVVDGRYATLKHLTTII